VTGRRQEWSDGAGGPVLAAVPDSDWRDRSACRATDPDLHFPEPGNTAQLAAAKAVCAACPVRAECLQFALDTGSRSGVFGGLGEDERAALHGPAAPAPSRRGAGGERVTLAERRARARKALQTGRKPCPGGCGRELPLEKFSRCAGSLDGRQRECKDCRRAAEAARRGEPAGKRLVAA
jgi:WhiB family redox-sensing transcriptional regulator